MKHLIKLLPQHVWAANGERLTVLPDYDPNMQYRNLLEVPHFLDFGKQGSCSVILPPTLVIEAGDEIANEYTFSALVTEVLERRPARGTWSKQRPDFVRLQYV